MPTRRRMNWPLSGVLFGAAALRLAVVWTLWDNLSDDRDAYLGLAHEIAAGHGFSAPGSAPPAPTAYRPPLYPYLLALLPRVELPAALGCLQAALGALTVWLTWRIARNLKFAEWSAIVAAGLVAVDPLLLQYTSMAMTETLCTLLTAALLAAATPRAEPVGTYSRSRQFVIGALFGLGVLCRPTLWAFGVLAAVAWTWRWIWSRREAGGDRASRGIPWPTVLALIAVVAPWAVRNWLQLGSPIITTTHGGYTLLLGNNPAFYREVVDQPLGTVWDGSHGPGQAAWADDVDRAMARDGVTAEVGRDRWMSRQAWRHIADDPQRFARACLLRLIRFWNVVPSGPAAQGVPQWLWYAVGIWYAAVFGLALRGLWRAGRGGLGPWLPLVLLIASFTAVHLLYWSNVRMRAPITPAVAVLAAFGLGTKSKP